MHLWQQLPIFLYLELDILAGRHIAQEGVEELLRDSQLRPRIL